MRKGCVVPGDRLGSLLRCQRSLCQGRRQLVRRLGSRRRVARSGRGKRRGKREGLCGGLSGVVGSCGAQATCPLLLAKEARERRLALNNGVSVRDDDQGRSAPADAGLEVVPVAVELVELRQHVGWRVFGHVEWVLVYPGENGPRAEERDQAGEQVAGGLSRRRRDQRL